MSTNGNQKGKRGEREFAALCREYGFKARRGQQYSGGDDSPDVITNVPGVHFEVKRTEALRLWPALDQAEDDAGSGRIPVVAHKPNRKEWVVVMYAEDFLGIMSDLKQTVKDDI